MWVVIYAGSQKTSGAFGEGYWVLTRGNPAPSDNIRGYGQHYITIRQSVDCKYIYTPFLQSVSSTKKATYRACDKWLSRNSIIPDKKNAKAKFGQSSAHKKTPSGKG